MTKTAFVFSGQGAQFAGMGKNFYERSDRAHGLFEYAESIRPGTLRQCFEGDAETLKKTENTQPCLYLAALAGAYALDESGIHADAVAGFSLGEIPALAYAGAFDAEAGFEIVCRRAELMSKAASENPASMAAVVRIPAETVETLCVGVDGLYPVNYNSPDQTVCSGTKEAMAILAEKVKAAGGRSIPLAVSGGFHSPFMDSAAEDFFVFLSGRELSKPVIDTYSDFTSTLYTDDVASLLASQINHPVRWKKLIENMYASGVRRFIEVGAGNVLTKLIKKIIPDAGAFSVSSYEDITDIINIEKAAENVNA